jgi:hypothetical protein
MLQRRRYSKAQFTAWYNPTHLNQVAFNDFLGIYFKIAGSHNAEEISSKNYFKWIYDAFYLCTQSVEHLANPQEELLFI